MSRHYGTVVVGAGMAGASLAAMLGTLGGAGAGRVLLLEAEDRPGYHTTGRSAAFWMESYGGPGVQPLTTASGPVLAELGFLGERRAVTLAHAGEEAALAAFVARFQALGVRVEPLTRAQIDALVPGLGPQWVAGALEPDCRDIDVAGLHQHYLTLALGAGAQLSCREGLVRAHRQGGLWHIELTSGEAITADVLVNAAGAWADRVAQACDVRPIGIQPYVRTMVQARVEPLVAPNQPLVLDLAGSFYFKPEQASIWLTPHDETPSAPCDAAPEELDVAVAIDRLERAGDWRVRKVEHKWAGLRSFAADRLPVFGWDARRSGGQAGFFWFAGQGGFGIQTAPAAADLGARLLLGVAPGAVDPAAYAPERFG
jgi:D-arginine dehydrogenase